jgi:hypothetical protein
VIRPLSPERQAIMNRWALWLTTAALIIFPFLYGLVALHRGEDADWDLMNYHFFDPFWVLHNHQHDIMPAQLQTYYNPLLDFPFYLAARHLSARTVAYGIAFVEGLSFPILYFIARVFTRRRVLALVAAGLGIFAAGAFSEIGSVMGDTLTAPFLLGGILLGLYACRPPAHGARRRVLALAIAAGLVSGFGSGLKLSAFPFTVATVVAFFVISLPFLRRLALAFACGCGALVGLLLSYGWWGYDLATRWGSPLLPYLNQVFASPYAPLASNTDARRLPHGVLQALFYPFLWTQQPLRTSPQPFRELSMPALEAVLLLLAIKAIVVTARQRGWRPMFGSDAERFMVVLTVVTYLIWVDVFAIYRYLIPLEMLTFVLLGVCVRRLFSPLKPWPIAAIVLVAIIVASLVTEETDNIGRTAWASRYITVLVPASIVHPAAFLMIGTQPEAYVVPYFPSDDFFGRIQANIRPTPTVVARIKKDLRAYRHVYLFWVDPNSFPTDAALLSQPKPPWAAYGFTVNTSACVAIPTRIGTVGQSVRTCPLVRS